MIRNTLLTLHILAVAAWFGGNVTQMFLLPHFERQGSAVAAVWHEGTAAMAKVYYSAAGAVIVATGVVMVLRGQAEWSDPFIAVGFLAIAIGGATGILFFGPRSQRAAEAHRANRSTEANAVAKSIGAGAMVDTLIVVTAVLSMVSRWGA